MVLACRLDRLQHEVPLPSREHQAQPLQPMFPKLHRAPVVQVSGRLIARHLLHLPQKIKRRLPERPTRLEPQRDKTVRASADYYSCTNILILATTCRYL